MYILNPQQLTVVLWDTAICLYYFLRAHYAETQFAYSIFNIIITIIHYVCIIIIIIHTHVHMNFTYDYFSSMLCLGSRDSWMVCFEVCGNAIVLVYDNLSTGSLMAGVSNGNLKLAIVKLCKFTKLKMLLILHPCSVTSLNVNIQF